MNNTSTPEGKNLAIVAYITFIGMFIAYSINRDKKQAFVTAHIKNMCGLVFGLLIAQTTQEYINSQLGDLLWWVVFSLWVYSIIAVLQNKLPNIPYISEKFQQWFTFLD